MITNYISGSHWRWEEVLPPSPSEHLTTCCCSSLSRVQLFATPWTAARIPCPSLFPRVCSDSCPLNLWCHPTISSSVVPFSSCLQSFPASGSFPVSWLFPSGGWSIGASASASVHPMNSQGWFPLILTGLIFLGAISFPKTCETEIITIISTLQMRKLKLRIIKEELVNGGARICF